MHVTATVAAVSRHIGLRLNLAFARSFLVIDDEPKILVDPIALRLVEMPKDIDANVEASKPVFSPFTPCSARPLR
jgi:hypothetical protein